MKEEALKLADFIEKHMVDFGLILGEVSRDHIVGTIRKLVAELDDVKVQLTDALSHKLLYQTNDKQGEPIAWISVLGIDHIGQKFTDIRISLTKTEVASIPLYTAPQTKPLSDEEIGLITTDSRWSHIETPLLAVLIRAIEERHGIK